MFIVNHVNNAVGCSYIANLHKQSNISQALRPNDSYGCT